MLRALLALLILAAGLAAESAVQPGQPFARGTCDGLIVTADGALTFWTFRDDFRADSRTAYTLIATRAAPVNEAGFIDPAARAGVYYTEQGPALAVEAGPGCRAGLSLPLPALTDASFTCTYTPRSPAPAAGRVMLILETTAGGPVRLTHAFAAGRLTAALNAAPLPPAPLPPSPAEGPAAPPFTLTAVRTGTAWLITLNGRPAAAFETPAAARLVRFMLVCEAADVRVNSISLAALRGSFTSEIIPVDPAATAGSMYIVWTDPRPDTGAWSGRLVTGMTPVDLAEPAWDNPALVFTDPRQDITALLKQTRVLRYRLDLTLSPTAIPVQAADLPAIRLAAVRQTPAAGGAE
ncbi:MAG: hypothetical protein ABIF71_00370 [Planctomycetota bacterium]